MKLEKEINRLFPGTKISFEGIDGSGKTTQTLLVQIHLEKMGYKVFRAPDNSDASGDNLDGKILSLLRQEKDRFFRIGYPVTENLLLASRAAYLDEVEILPKLKSGYVVLSDRDIDTFIAYGMPSLRKVYPQRDPRELMDWMISIVSIGRTHPNLTILFKPQLNEFLSRATVGLFETSQKDNFQPRDWEFMRQVITYYEWLKDRFSHRIQILDIDRKDKQEVLEEVLNVIIPFLEKNDTPKIPR